MLNTFSNTDTANSRRQQRDRQMELMEHAANGTGPFSSHPGALLPEDYDDTDVDMHGDFEIDFEDSDSDSDNSSVSDGNDENNDNDNVSVNDDGSVLQRQRRRNEPSSFELTPNRARQAAVLALQAADESHEDTRYSVSSGGTKQKNKSVTVKTSIGNANPLSTLSNKKVGEGFVSQLLRRISPTNSLSSRNSNRSKISPRNNYSTGLSPRSQRQLKSYMDQMEDVNLAPFPEFVEDLWPERSNTFFSRFTEKLTSLCGLCFGTASRRRKAYLLTSILACIFAFLITRNLIHNNDRGSSSLSMSPDQYKARSAMIRDLIINRKITADEDFKSVDSVKYALDFLTKSDSHLNLSKSSDIQVLLEKYALVVLYYSTGGIRGMPDDATGSDGNVRSNDDDFSTLMKFGHDASWETEDGWMVNAMVCDNWYGVACGKDNSVIGLNLTDNTLAGSIPSELHALKSLDTLDLSYNFISSTIPPSISTLTKLKNLYLGGEGAITGTIPTQLGELSRLEELFIFDTLVTGAIPSTLGNLENLEGLGLYANGLSSSIPTELGNLAKLHVLYLDENDLTGDIPASLGQLKVLSDFRLRKNVKLDSFIPTEIGNMVGLEHLYLDNASLKGAIPSEIGNLSNLKQVHLYKNKLTSTIPSELEQLDDLELLYLDTNDLTGSIPSSFGALVNLSAFYLFRNKLTGIIPPELGNLVHLEYIRLNENSLTGSVPTELGQLKYLKILYLFQNQLTGKVPSDLGNLKEVANLRLQYNNLKGEIPESICKLRTDGGGTLKTLIADCGDNNAKLTCDCCTSCVEDMD
eukprot:CAMPEP_0194367408 /NCGR_PEP_ID=MMETSP0174-20130528/15479_1 /TAXON_ID=216777 /ORGANISM="Proboscia alata, Strain PI-D3" /LENGTH=806 /DNA_ID=CAMNT_0039143119 /DNA_START=77 /DNA_END=2497 /DNA_ORIENTATION=-